MEIALTKKIIVFTVKISFTNSLVYIKYQFTIIHFAAISFTIISLIFPVIPGDTPLHAAACIIIIISLLNIILLIK